MSELLTSPLHERHVALGAKFAEFGGWSMPLQYTSIVAEHNATRQSVGVFDVSHLGKVLVKGPGAADFVNRCFTNDLRKIGPGKSQYTLCCNAEGGVVDDLIQYYVADDEIFLIPNAANTSKVVELLEAEPHEGIEIVNQHRDFAVVAVQGQDSDKVLEALGLPFEHEYTAWVDADYQGHPLRVCRTGYTGEKGYELVIPAADALPIFDAIMEQVDKLGGLPAGLGARDTLRTEMGYPLHGHELSLEINPLEAVTGWAVAWDKDTFWGADRLREIKAQGTTRRTRALVAEGKGIPRDGMLVLKDGVEVGHVTSGTFSPTLGKGIALALVDKSVGLEDAVDVQVRNRNEPFTVKKPPLIQPQTRS